MAFLSCVHREMVFYLEVDLTETSEGGTAMKRIQWLSGVIALLVTLGMSGCGGQQGGQQGGGDQGMGGSPSSSPSSSPSGSPDGASGGAAGDTGGAAGGGTSGGTGSPGASQ